MDINAVVKMHQSRAKWQRLAKHLGISMSLMSDTDVITKLSSVSGPLASTESVERSKWSHRVKSFYGNTLKLSNRPAFKTTFNEDDMPDDLATWLGTAWHELGHILWSPFRGINITIGLNLLEDARVETLLLLKFPKTRPALLQLLTYELKRGNPLKNQSHAPYQYAWMAGRMHIDKAIRSKMRHLVVGTVADEIDDIFREYLAMGDKLDIRKADSLATRLSRLLNLNQVVTEDQSGCVGISHGGVAIGEEIDIDIDTSGIGGDPQPNEPEAPKNDASKTANKVAGIIRDLKDQVMQDLANDTEWNEELESLQKLVNGAGGMYGQPGNTQVVTPKPEAVSLAREIRRIAAGFNDESAKGIVRYRDTGRLRPARYERTGDLDTAYDLWEPGLEQEMFIGLVVDVSGSMGSAPVNEIVYALEVGLGDVATVDIVYFNDDYWTPDTTNTQHRMIAVGRRGGTDPSDAVGYMYPRIINHAAHNKMMVLYTDGAFNSMSNYETVGAYVDALIQQGVRVKLVAEPNADIKFVQRRSSYLASTDIHTVGDLRDLPDIVLDWTRTVLVRPR